MESNAENMSQWSKWSSNWKVQDVDWSDKGDELEFVSYLSDMSLVKKANSDSSMNRGL